MLELSSIARLFYNFFRHVALFNQWFSNIYDRLACRLSAHFRAGTTTWDSLKRKFRNDWTLNDLKRRAGY